ncbi:MAG: phosphate signaling complex protein PhoU [bacterium]|nr:phosphate signaling complex protein PhoU [bacterium]
MVRSAFLKELQELENVVLELGSRVEEAIGQASRSLVTQDPGLAREVIAGDDCLDALQLEIENRCLNLLALQQPLSRDLRFIGTALKVAIDLERIGDHAADIAQVAIRLSGEDYIKPLIDIPRMADLARGMLRDSLTAYVRQDTRLALSLAQADTLMDSLYNQVFRELLTYMTSDPATIPQATRLLLVAQHLERVADHVTNIGEGVIYMVDGQRTSLNP